MEPVIRLKLSNPIKFGGTRDGPPRGGERNAHDSPCGAVGSAWTCAQLVIAPFRFAHARSWILARAPSGTPGTLSAVSGGAMNPGALVRNGLAGRRAWRFWCAAWAGPPKSWAV